MQRFTLGSKAFWLWAVLTAMMVSDKLLTALWLSTEHGREMNPVCQSLIDRLGAWQAMNMLGIVCVLAGLVLYLGMASVSIGRQRFYQRIALVAIALHTPVMLLHGYNFAQWWQ